FTHLPASGSDADAVPALTRQMASTAETHITEILRPFIPFSLSPLKIPMQPALTAPPPRSVSAPHFYFFFFFLLFFFFFLLVCFFLKLLTALQPVTLSGVVFSMTFPFWPASVVGSTSGSAIVCVTFLNTWTVRRPTRLATFTRLVTVLVGLQRSPCPVNAECGPAGSVTMKLS